MMLRRVAGSEPPAVRGRRLALGKGVRESGALAGEAAVGSGMVEDVLRGVDRRSRGRVVDVLGQDSLSFAECYFNKS